MQLTSAPAVIKEVIYDRESHDYAAYVTIDGERQCVGYGKTHSQADELCNEYAYSFYSDNATPEVAAAIAVEAFDPAPPVDDDIEDNFGGFRQTIELERRFEFSAAPTEWSF